MVEGTEEGRVFKLRSASERDALRENFNHVPS